MTPPSGPVVFVVDDDRAMRKSLRWLITSAGLSVETYSSAREFLSAYEPSRPSCLVLDVRLQQRSGLDLQAELATRTPPIPILFISAFADVPTAVRAMRAGAMDFLQKPFSDQLLLDRIWQAIEWSRETRAAGARRAELMARLRRLTPRERDVLDGLLAGKRSREIAAELALSARTVETHRTHVLHKIEVGSVAKLVRLLVLAQVDGRAGEGPSRPHAVDRPTSLRL